MNAEIIAEIVMRCIGHIDAFGDANYDSQSLKNIKMLFKVLDILLDEVQKHIPESKSHEGSVAYIGYASIGYLAGLRDDIRDWLEQRR